MAEGTNIVSLFRNQRHYDAVLFALLDDAREAVDDYVIARDAAYEARERADADPDSPDVMTASTAAVYAHWERHGYNEKSEAWNHAHMRAQGALLTAFRVRVATIDGALAKVKYVLEFETKVGKDEDLETWWFTHEWLDELREDLYEVRVIERTRERDPAGVRGVGHHQPHPSRFGAGRDSPS